MIIFALSAKCDAQMIVERPDAEKSSPGYK